MMDNEKYSHSLKGVAMYALDQWDWFHSHPNRDELTEHMRSASMAAYADILFQITGRRIGTERDKVLGIVNIL